MKFPQEIHATLDRRYKANYRDWLNGTGTWPLSFPLSPPTEKEVQLRRDLFRKWIDEWKAWSGIGSVIWKDVNWRTLGTQSLPSRIEFSSPLEIATSIGEKDHWSKCLERRSLLDNRWPHLRSSLERIFGTKRGPTLDDLQMLIATLDWLEENPRSNLYPRQVPVTGIDSKWIENHVPWLVAGLTREETKESNPDFYTLSGLKCPPRLIRLRILDPALRSYVGGLSDLSVMPEELARWDMLVKRTYIVENLQTGLAFEDIPGSIVFMALGNGVEVLKSIPWISKSTCVYWGDIDTHGYFILNQLRTYFPQATSILMDEQTVLAHRSLWASETKQHSTSALPHLTETERSVFEALRGHCWKSNLRLEQERIPWDYAWSRVKSGIR